MASSNNFGSFSNRMQRMKLEVETKVKEAVEFYASEIELEAIRKAPGPGERIRIVNGKTLSQETIRRDSNWVPISQAIGSKTENGGLSATIFIESSAGEIAMYVEVGTGQDASSYLVGLPKEWQEAARRFYIDGKGKIIHQPYFYPAIIKNESLFISELKNILKTSF